MNDNLSAFLDMIAASELTQAVLDNSDDGYNVLVGSTPNNILTFPSYATHPNIYNAALRSTAAGRYQILKRNFDYYKITLKLPDFGPDSQDAIAVQLITECHAIEQITAGYVRIAIAECSREWASLPGNSYGQHENKMADLCNYYLNAGGNMA